MDINAYLLLFAAAVAPASALAGDGNNDAPDTLRSHVIDEAVVVASPKETTEFKNQPVSVSLFGRRAIERNGVSDVKGFSAYAPNFFMPDYGSRYTSAVYIRGIGSRINTPAVGLYVDNVPYADKSAYDFSFLDVTRVDVLRGPQGTLYGRNSMGGLVRIFTADPFTHRGTDVSVGATSRTAGRRAKAVTYLHPSATTALSVGAFYEGENGYYRNATTGEKADAANAAGGKIRFGWKSAERLRFDLTASYEYSDEDACPYFLTSASESMAQYGIGTEGAILQNRQSNYRRELLNVGLGTEWQADAFTLSSITAVQHLRDRLFMDQDFSAADIFSLAQKQRLNAVSEELSLKSRGQRRWQWVTGAFFNYRSLHTTCPVAFYEGGISYLNNTLGSALPASPAMSVAFTGSGLCFNAAMSTPDLNAALFHQSTFDLGSGLSLTAGLRLDYDHTSLDLTSGDGSGIPYTFSMPSFRINADLSADPSLAGRLKTDTWQLLPKVALQYRHRSGRGNVYVAVSKGYRSGGYNIQSYSDLSQTQLRRSMMLGVKDYSIGAINAMPLPDAVKERAIAGMTSALDPNIPAAPDAHSLAYKPEQSWNYEIGGHLNIVGDALTLYYTFFYMHTKDQQLARFAGSGLGREMVNAGRTRSLGAEASLRSTLLDGRLRFTADYGYTDACFTAYDLGTNSAGEAVDYDGNHVPYAPQHTLALTADYRQPLQGRALRAIGGGLSLNGAGRIWWDEANTYSQPFYANLSARLTAEIADGVSVSVWGRNLTAARYDTFAFTTLGNRFAQVGAPRTFGVDVNLHF